MSKAIKWDVTDDAGMLGRMVKAVINGEANRSKRIAICAASAVLCMVKPGDSQGNATPMTQLVNALGYDGKPLVKWALSTGAYRIGVDKDTKRDVFKKADDASFAGAVANYTADPKGYASDLMAKNYRELTPPPPAFKGFNALGKLFAILDEANGVMTDGKRKDHEANDFRGIEELKAMLAKHERPARKGKSKAVTPAVEETVAAAVAA